MTHSHHKITEEVFDEELTKAKREELNSLSEQVYGKRLKWQKIMRKGQLQPGVDTNGNGNPISVMRMHHFTLSEIYRTMKQILVDREEAEKAAQAAKTVAETEKVT